MSSAACIFCKIIKGEIPSLKLFESASVFAFLDIQPLSVGHAVRLLSLPWLRHNSTLALNYGKALDNDPDIFQLVIPKHHGAKLTDIPDDQLQEVLPVVKKIAAASGAENWNCLQNNGRLAHQVVDHVHFHMIPKPNEKEGLGIGWPAQETDMDKLKQLHEQLKSKM